MRYKIYVITPIKNEDWVLDYFLSTTSLWADKIIVADQNSDDNSISIAKKFKKVKIIKNNNFEYSEKERYSLLLEEVRKNNEEKIIFALDADEILSSEIFNPKMQEFLQNLHPGDSLHLNWINIWGNFEKYWKVKMGVPIIFVDDGKDTNQMTTIHGPKLPITDFSRTKYIEDLNVIHLQYIDFDRLRSKHRWYQAWEFSRDTDKSGIHLYRQYNHFDFIKKENLTPNLYSDFFKHYEDSGLNIKTRIKLGEREKHYWDYIVINMIKKGELNLSKVDLWNKDDLSKYNSIVSAKEKIVDIRNNLDKLIFFYLKSTQKYYPNKFLRYVDLILGKFW
jgi:hypothetical protein